MDVMNRRRFGLVLGAALAAWRLPLLGQDEGHGKGKDKGDHDHEGNGHGDGEGNDRGRGEGKGHGRGDGQGNGHGNGNAYGHSKNNNRQNNDGNDNNHHRTYGPYPQGQPYPQSQSYFRPQDNAYWNQYYNGPRNLPPGLRKKYYRNGTLPPGWQNQWQPLPQQAYSQLPPPPAGYQAGYYNGYAVVVNPRTRVIYDVLDVIAAAQGR